jgi:hypothetical protein
MKVILRLHGNISSAPTIDTGIHMWQKEPLVFMPVNDRQWMSETDVGESLLDQYYILYLAFEISKKHKDWLIQ